MPPQSSSTQTPNQRRAANQSTATSARPPPTPKNRRNGGGNLTTRRKRKRSPAPLTVSNVFNTANAPSSCLQFWQWPVTSWYFGEVTSADLQYTTDNPFSSPNDTLNLQQHAKSALPVNYRLQWLYEDAAMHANGVIPNPPPAIESISSMRNKEPNACARPSPFLDPNGSVGESSTQPRGRLRSRTRARANNTLANETHSTRLRKRRRSDPTHPNPDADVQHMALADGLRPCADETPVPLPPFLSEERLASLCETPHPAFRTDNPLGAYMKPADGSPLTSFQNCDHTCVERPKPSYPSVYPPSSMALPTKRDAKVESKAVTPKQASESLPEGNADASPESPRKKVCLQFVSEKDPSVLTSVHYAMPDRQRLKLNSSDALPSVELHHMDVSFRDVQAMPCDNFDDGDETDELAEELERAKADLRALADYTCPVRATARDAILNELEEQKDLAEMVTEEKSVVARLAEIQKEKAEAARMKAADETSRSARARRLSARTRIPPRRRKGGQVNSCSVRSSDVDGGSVNKDAPTDAKTHDDSNTTTTVSGYLKSDQQVL